MKSLVIHEPARLIGLDASSARVLSEDPREGIGMMQYAPNDVGFNCTFSGAYGLSSAFVGYVSGLRPGDIAGVFGKPQGGGDTVFLGALPAAVSRRGGMGHGFIEFPYQFLEALYFRFQGPSSINASSLSAGVVMASYSKFRAEWGHEWGAGRPLDDTSAVERLPGGSFAIDRGVVTSGYQWTFGDLSDEERERLYDIHRAVGRSRSVLVIEDDDRTPGLYERMHWGLLTKLDTYSRVDPTATTWGMQVADWL